MIFPEEKRRVVRIRSNQVDWKRQRRRKRRFGFSFLLILLAIAISLCVYFRVDKKIASFIGDTGKLISKNIAEKRSSDAKKKQDAETQDTGSADDAETEDATGDDSSSEESGQAAETEPSEEDLKAAKKEQRLANRVTIAFTGDVVLSESIQANYDADGVSGVIDDKLRRQLAKCDVLEINNEFPFSTRGAETFNTDGLRVDPGYVSVLGDIGVDIAGLANNHVLDYGKDALSDTFTTLDDAGIDYIGAGSSIERAEEYTKFEKNGKTYGFLAASRVIPDVSCNVKNSQPGVFATYDPADLLKRIEAAKQECDYVFVCVHWGQEGKTEVIDYETPMAHKYIDAGADAVIGCHPHVLQKIEYYDGKPIFYSLGNFIFGDTISRTVAVRFKEKNGEMSVSLIPAKAEGAKTMPADSEEGKAIFSYLQGLSSTAVIDENGNVSPKE